MILQWYALLFISIVGYTACRTWTVLIKRCLLVTTTGPGSRQLSVNLILVWPLGHRWLQMLSIIWLGRYIYWLRWVVFTWYTVNYGLVISELSPLLCNFGFVDFNNAVLTAFFTINKGCCHVSSFTLVLCKTWEAIASTVWLRWFH